MVDGGWWMACTERSRSVNDDVYFLSGKGVADRRQSRMVPSALWLCLWSHERFVS